MEKMSWALDSLFSIAGLLGKIISGSMQVCIYSFQIREGMVVQSKDGPRVQLCESLNILGIITRNLGNGLLIGVEITQR